MASKIPDPSCLCCREVNEFIVPYGEDLLGPEIAAQFEDHLSKCSCCRAYLEQYRTTIALAKEAEKASPCKVPEGLARTCISFLREHT